MSDIGNEKIDIKSHDNENVSNSLKTLCSALKILWYNYSLL